MVLLFFWGCSGTNANSPQKPETGNSSPALASSTPQVDQVLEHSCFDCHSDQDSASWNARIAPSYIFGAVDARKALNFSSWPSYSAERKNAEREAISKTIEDGTMPPWDYELFHPSSRLNSEERNQLLEWASRQR
jgi:hypothetical protein